MPAPARITVRHVGNATPPSPIPTAGRPAPRSLAAPAWRCCTGVALPHRRGAAAWQVLAAADVGRDHCLRRAGVGLNELVVARWVGQRGLQHAADGGRATAQAGVVGRQADPVAQRAQAGLELRALPG